MHIITSKIRIKVNKKNCKREIWHDGGKVAGHFIEPILTLL